MHPSLARPIEKVHDQIDFVFVNGGHPGSMFNEVKLKIKAVDEALPRLVHGKIDPFNIVAIVFHEYLLCFFDLSQFLEECFPSQRELGVCSGPKDVSGIFDFFILTQFLGPLEQYLCFLQVDREEGVDEILKLEVLRKSIFGKLPAEHAAAKRISSHQLSRQSQKTGIELKIRELDLRS